MIEKLEDLIFEVRGEKVILVRDLAKVYNIKTKVLNQMIRRNLTIFNDNVYFQMLDSEFDIWRSQIVTSKNDKIGLRVAPYVLTKDGILVLSTFMKNENFIEINRKILKVFDEKINKSNLVIISDFFFKNQRKIENLIYEINGIQVMLDSDLALLYGSKNGTKEINQAVKNNMEKFPKRFSWVLSDEESKIFLVINFDQKNIETRGGKYKNPRVFTEQGTAMLSTVIKSSTATQVSIQIMDAFVNMRHFIQDNRFLLESNINIMNKLSLQDKKNLEYDEKFKLLFSMFESKEKKEFIFFDGQVYDAYSKIIDILKLARESLIIIDPYLDKSILDMISCLNVNVIIITKQDRNLKIKDIEKYNLQYDNLTMIYDYTFHDRYIIVDNSDIYHSGTSLTGVGKKTFSIDKLEEPDIIKLLLNKINELKK